MDIFLHNDIKRVCDSFCNIMSCQKKKQKKKKERKKKKMSIIITRATKNIFGSRIGRA